MFGTIIIFVIILAILVLSHEFGHFIAARRFGVKVEEFGFGFPPRLLSFKKGQTVYSLNLIPLGGFVKIKGENGELANEPDSFGHQKAWRRLVMLVGGVAMNLLAAAVLLSIGFNIGLPSGLQNLGFGARVSDRKIEVVQILAGSPAEVSGVALGDVIGQADDLVNPDFLALQNYLTGKIGQPVHFVLERDGEKVAKNIIPIKLEQTGKGGIGVALFERGLVSYPWYLAIYQGAKATAVYFWEILRAFGILILNLFQGQPISESVSGPVGIAVLTGRAARLGLSYLLQFAALLSINLAIINILPFPALDGGRVLFLAIEKWRGKPMRQKLEHLIHFIGFALLLILVLIVTARDIGRFNLTWERLRGLFFK